MNDFIRIAAERRVRCELMASRLRMAGYDCDWQRVNRNYLVFERWAERRLPLGYLIRRTGMRRL